MKILVTGAAGFIGFHVCQALLSRGDNVVGLDNFNPYYDVSLKRARIDLLKSDQRFQILELDLKDQVGINQAFSKERPQRVIHLAAQAGVRYSLTNPYAYGESNLTGFLNILEICRQHKVEHLVYASSSSVYGANTKTPFSTDDKVDHPLSLYAATKKANELMAHSYSHLFALPTTGLRFFTVYGPWGRPDMAVYIFTKAILEDQPIQVFNHGKMQRDMTYIDDIVEGVIRTCDHVPTPNPQWNAQSSDSSSSSAPYRIYNIGNNNPVELGQMISTIENVLGKTAQKTFLEMQPGDVPATYADVESLVQNVGFQPNTPIEVGISRFVEWYRNYYRC